MDELVKLYGQLYAIAEAEVWVYITMYLFWGTLSAVVATTLIILGVRAHGRSYDSEIGGALGIIAGVLLILFAMILYACAYADYANVPYATLKTIVEIVK